MKFKVGDRVKRKPGLKQLSWITDYTIVKVNKPGFPYCITFINNKGKETSWPEHEFELDTEDDEVYY